MDHACQGKLHGGWGLAQRRGGGEIKIASAWCALHTIPGDLTCVHQSLESGGAAAQKDLCEAYEGLLQEFPLCYGYWHKLAELEKARGKDNSMAPAVAVYERGIAAVKCWELYLRFCGCAAKQCGVPEQTGDFNAPQDALEQSADEKFVRDLFTRAAREVGSTYDSVKLWDAWFAFEEARPKDVLMGGVPVTLPTRLAAVAFRAAVAPIDPEASAKYFEKFTGYLGKVCASLWCVGVGVGVGV